MTASSPAAPFIQWPLAKTYPCSTAGLVGAKHPLAAQAGVAMLQRGGSAIDAAIATSFVSGVVEPYMSGVGGGGLAIYQPVGGAPTALHFGMRAPASAREDMYEVVPGTQDLDLFGWPRTVGDANLAGPNSIALPGLVQGLARLHQIGGRLPWEQLIEPAVALAHDGFPVDWITSLRILQGHDLLSRYPSSRSIFLSGGRAPIPDLVLGAEILKQRDLSGTLRAIASDPQALSKNELGRRIAAAAGHRFSPAEVAEHRPLEGQAPAVSFGGLEVHGVPWATGGVTVLEWLGILRELDPPADGTDPDFWWAIVRSGQVAMADRLRRLADPDFAPFPDEILTSSYHRDMADAIRAGQIDRVALPAVDGSTSHLNAVDAEGNAVTITQTLLGVWGSGVVADGTGVCMNNGMMWFDPEPGRPNSIAAGKLPLANMAPVLVTKNGAAQLVMGASGGRRILPAMVQILARVALLGQSMDQAVAAPRIELSRDPAMADIRFGARFAEELSRRLEEPVILKEPSLGTSHWASAVGLMRLDDGSWTGGADPYTMACVLAP